MLWHRVNLRVQFLLDLYHVFLVILGNQVDCEPDLTESTASTDSVQIGAAFIGEVEVDNYIDCRDIDTSGDEVGTDQSLEFSLSEAFEDLCSFIWFHT